MKACDVGLSFQQNDPAQYDFQLSKPGLIAKATCQPEKAEGRQQKAGGRKQEADGRAKAEGRGDD